VTRTAPPWRPSFGAWLEDGGTRFRVWAPESESVGVRLESGRRRGSTTALAPLGDGTFGDLVEGVAAGDRYRYRLDGRDALLPDPAARFQPDGVRGPSEVIDPASFRWSDAGWSGVPLEDLVLYELHVGAFSERGTFAGVTDRLPYLRDLGVSAIELMPVADFPGERNWGYDGVALFAPARCYGRPDDLRRLVDAAHRVGIAVHLDVVYNHLGPDGAALPFFTGHYFSSRHRTPWGQAVNLDGEHSEVVRELLIDNALHWIHEYHLDGLRLDATHALMDDGPRHFLAELAARVHASSPSRKVLLVAEDHRNLARLVTPERSGGWGVDAVWADDFHHLVRRHLAGDHEGYFADFSGSLADVATTIEQGWFYVGQRAPRSGEHRGSDPRGLPPRRFVFCLQNHDQVGNRALGERLHHQIDAAAYRAASAVLLFAPQTPLLFMGQEWGASTPFLYFTDHGARLGEAIRKGRRREFERFSAFADPRSREQIPDPQALSTFLASKLVWSEIEQDAHRTTLSLYRALLALRRTEPALCSTRREDCAAVALDEETLLVRRAARDGRGLALVARLCGSGTAELNGPDLDGGSSGSRSAPAPQVLLTTEDAEFSADPSPPRLAIAGDALRIEFTRPAAVILATAA